MRINDQLIRKRFESLDLAIQGIPKKLSSDRNWYIDESHDTERVQWLTNTQHFLRSVFGKDSVYFKEWEELKVQYNDPFPEIRRCYAIFLAAKEDYENGYFFDQEELIEANILGRAIEQAEILFEKEYIQAAAIIAGVALETRLRIMCDQISVIYESDKSTIQSLNQILYKDKQYSQPQMQEITTWGNIRNAAAHGKWGEFTKQQVDLMIKGITRFLASSTNSIKSLP